MESIDIKTPATQHALHPLVAKRWSARSFAPKPIADTDMLTLLEAATWSASSMNEQPWRFVYAHREDTGAFARFFDCLMTGNQPWCKNASALVLVLARRNFVKNGEPNRHSMFDVGAACTTLLIQAASIDIYGHLLGGFHMAKTIEDFALTDDWEPACFLALGYLDDPQKLEEPFRTRELTPRARKPLSDVVERLR
jgi:nitroreductase